MNIYNAQALIRAGYQLFRLGSSTLKEHMERADTPEESDSLGCRCLFNKDYKGAIKWFRLGAEGGWPHLN